jgi:chromosome segregation ATPase
LTGAYKCLRSLLLHLSTYHNISCNSPQRRTRRGGQRNRIAQAAARQAGGAAGSPGTAKLSAERAAQLEAELAALRAALAEAEERQVEAQMAVLTLETDNTTLQAQLEGMRAQKQQLETMLLFGGGRPDH